MANVGSGAAGKTLIGAGNGASPTFASIGTNSGLSANGVVIAEGDNAFNAVTVGTTGQILTSNGPGADPSFQTPGTIKTIAGDSGTISGLNVTISALQIGRNCGATVGFTNSGTVSTLSVTDVNSNVAVGSGAGGLAMTGTGSNACFGRSAGASLTNSGLNAFFGGGCGSRATASGNNSGCGYGSLSFITTGGYNSCLGQLSGASYTSSESSNVCISNQGTVSESNVIRIGTQGTGNGQQNTCYIAGITGNTVSNQQFVTINSSTGQLGVVSNASITITGDSGSITGSSLTIYSNQASLGAGSSVAFVNSGSTSTLQLTDSNHSTFLGNGAGKAGISGANNSGQGYLCMASATSADSNCGLGSTSLTNLTSGGNNCAVGVVALQNLTTGSNCVGIGHAAGQSYTTSETNNICIGASVTGTVGESNTTRIGNGSTTTCFITGISGVTVTGTAVLCSAAGQLGTVVSSARYKENIRPIRQDISILHLEPKAFNYKQDENKTTKYGLIAEDVDANFPYLCFYNEDGKPESVMYQELSVLLLHEIQKLNKRIEYLESKVA